MTTILNLEPITTLTREQFFQLCQANPDLQLERSVNGELIIVTPIGGESGNQEANLIGDVIIWNRQTGLVVCLYKAIAQRIREVAICASRLG